MVAIEYQVFEGSRQRSACREELLSMSIPWGAQGDDGVAGGSFAGRSSQGTRLCVALRAQATTPAMLRKIAWRSALAWANRLELDPLEQLGAEIALLGNPL